MRGDHNYHHYPLLGISTSLTITTNLGGGLIIPIVQRRKQRGSKSKYPDVGTHPVAVELSVGLCPQIWSSPHLLLHGQVHESDQGHFISRGCLLRQIRSCVEALTDVLCLSTGGPVFCYFRGGQLRLFPCPWKLWGQLKAWQNSFPVGLGRATCAGSLGPTPGSC